MSGDRSGIAPWRYKGFLLAATALRHQLTLVTRNVGDVALTGVKVLNPFSQPAGPNPPKRPRRPVPNWVRGAS